MIILDADFSYLQSFENLAGEKLRISVS